MDLDFFLWPLLLPLFYLVLYTFLKHRQLFRFSISIFISGVCIVGLYWPLLSFDFFQLFNYFIVKYLLFIFLPVLLIILLTRKHVTDLIKSSGLQRKGWKNSIYLCILFLPIMLFVSGGITYLSWNAVQQVPNLKGSGNADSSPHVPSCSTGLPVLPFPARRNESDGCPAPAATDRNPLDVLVDVQSTSGTRDCPEPSHGPTPL